MQTKDQVKNWKVVVSAASVAALGLTGLAVASPDGSNNAPPAINIQDQRDGSTQLTTTTTHAFEVVPGPVTQFDSIDSIDSVDDTVLASADLDDSVDDSPDTAVADDSPDDSPIDSMDDSPVDDSADDSGDDSADDSADSSD
ncbi:MAG: hypothetical protein WEB67_08005 [Acidimicrobiia bacterium]